MKNGKQADRRGGPFTVAPHAEIANPVFPPVRNLFPVSGISDPVSPQPGLRRHGIAALVVVNQVEEGLDGFAREAVFANTFLQDG
jgi:hypothetical protein